MKENIITDDLMVKLGMRQPHVVPRDKEVWTKTQREKKMLKRYKSKERIHFHTIPIKSIPVWSKLIIYLKKNKEYPKTTYSIKCWQHEISNILSNYCQVKKGKVENLVSKYSYNGKTYAPNERPFWP